VRGDCQSPVRDTFTTHLGPVVKVGLLNIANGVGFYAAFVYAVTYIRDIDRLDESVALDLNTLAMAVLLLVLPVTAALADKFGRKPMIVAGCTILMLGAVPFFWLMHHTDPVTIFFGELGFVLGVGVLGGGLAAANVELIPEPVCCTGLALAYNASVGWFGGTTPLIATWLITQTGDPLSPAYWVAAAACVSLLASIFLIRETRPGTEQP